MEQEQQGETNAIYGDHLLARLSEDLSETLGSGFSKSNLYNMRRFYLAHEENLQATGKLTWTQHVELLPIKNKAIRRKIEQRIVSQKWSCQQIRQAVNELVQAGREARGTLKSRRGFPWEPWAVRQESKGTSHEKKNHISTAKSRINANLRRGG